MRYAKQTVNGKTSGKNNLKRYLNTDKTVNKAIL